MTPKIETDLDQLCTRLRDRVRLLAVVISDAWGGLEQTALHDVNLLLQLGFPVTLLVKKDSPLHEEAKKLTGKIKTIAFGRSVGKNFDFKFTSFLREVVRKEEINIVHLHQNSLLKMVVPAIWLNKKVALVISRHILNDHSKRDPLHALLYRRVDYILCLSNTMRNNLLATFPVAEKKLRIVNLGVDLKRFQTANANPEKFRLQNEFAAEHFVVGVVGRLDPAKGQDLLIKAIAQVRSQIPEIRGVIVGAESPGLAGEYLKELERSLEQLRLKKTIRITGPTKDIPSVMAGLDLFVMPSVEEAFGLVALEAMAMQTPCILSQAGSAEELALNGRAITFRPGDAYDLSNKIKYLFENSKFRRQMAERGHKFVWEEHSQKERLLRTLDIYMRCARRRLGQGSTSSVTVPLSVAKK